ncbi:SSI family serine proteinase inhibitor [Actinosynnema sp. NPDC091369]
MITADQLEETTVPVTRLTRGLLPALAVATALGGLLAPAATAAPTTDLTISVADPLAPVAREYRLTCDPDGGTHPRPEAACDAIRKSPGAIEPPPPTSHCYDRVYGPQRAKASGLLFGVEVAATFSRVNSCEEDRWQAWLPVWG